LCLFRLQKFAGGQRDNFFIKDLKFSVKTKDFYKLLNKLIYLK
jgi:hypothetical protein